MTISAANPLAERSHLPFQLPDFAALTAVEYREALFAGMDQQREALAALAADDRPATVENVLHAWEASGALLERTLLAFSAVWMANSTPELDALHEESSPKLAQHSDAIWLDRALYERFLALQARAETGEVTLDAEDAYLLSETLASFTRAGVALDEADQAQLRALNTDLAELGTQFQRVNREARVAGAVVVTDVAELDGLSEEEIAAIDAGDGTWRIELVNTSQQPLMAKLHHRGLRQRLYEASITRGLGGEHDARGIIAAIARARSQKATLLGYENFAALRISSGCAKTTDAVNALMGRLGRAARAQADADATTLAARFATLEPGAEFAPWDWEYVAEVVRAEQFGIDEAELAPYLDVHRVLEAVYVAAHDLYGITFEPRPDLVGHTPDADVYEVRDADGSPIGLFCMDFWARPTKQGGAWMTSLVNETTVFKSLPVVTNNCNYTPATTTITWDGVHTMFHEFGHALHGLFATTKYPSLSGTSTPRDFVEFPSQVNEFWAMVPDRVLPANLLAKLEAASSFNQGFGTLEIMAATLLDQAWHQTPLAELPTSAEEVEAFEQRALAAWGVDSALVPPRYRSAYFNHIWGSGYAAGYYGYTWAQVMDADAVAWFTENGGGTRENGDYFRRTLLAPGGSVDPLETYRAFRGRDPELGPLLERLGLHL